MALATASTSLEEMNDVVATAQQAVQELLQAIPLTANSAEEAAQAIDAIEGLGRLVDAARVRVLAPLVGDLHLVEQLGHASPGAAVAAIAGVRESAARARLRIASAVTPETALTGAILPPRSEAVAAALEGGDLGLDAAGLIISELTTVKDRVDRDVVEIAERIMVARATGHDANGTAIDDRVSVDFLSTELRMITATIDPDGARPREERSLRSREVRIGAQGSDGNHGISGRIVPAAAALFKAIAEAQRRSPRFRNVGEDSDDDSLSLDDVIDGMHDDRTPAQRLHDALLEILIATAATPDAPRLDGAPVTVLVTATAEDLNNPDGLDSDPIGTMVDSTFPVSRHTLERYIDAFGYRKVAFDENGAVLGISSVQRCFTPAQRLAIAARDGARCATPGCTSPHYMLQAHHVVPVRENGRTITSNGILLCFWHHLQVDTGVWRYHMINGVPHARRSELEPWLPLRPPARLTRTPARLARPPGI
ncbi:MAG: DUF222 domain-containing protein [Rhodoglobus sp.]